MALEKSQKIILEAIYRHDGEWNWYKLGRACIHLLDSPADLTLKPLLHAGFVEERPVADEPLPRLHVTAAGKAALRNMLRLTQESS
jgi:hypothetical protein